jgi:hypothetical protein
MCDSKRPEVDGAITTSDIQTLSETLSAGDPSSVADIDGASDDVVHVPTEEEETRVKMDKVSARLVNKEVIFIESAEGVRAALDTIDKAESQAFARKCLTEILDIFVNLKVHALTDPTWAGLELKWKESAQDQALKWKQVRQCSPICLYIP